MSDDSKITDMEQFTFLANNSELFTKGKEFLTMFNKVMEFTKEMLQENEKLQYNIQELNLEREKLERIKRPGGRKAELFAKLEKLKGARELMLNKYQQVEEENLDFANRYVEIEEENNNMANLYVAGYQLHSTLDFKEVVSIINEIIINLIGADTFCLLMVDEKTSTIYPITCEGIETDAFPVIKVGSGIIGESAGSGEMKILERGEFNPDAIEPLKPWVCIPLKIKDRVIGLIVIYSLLVQKEDFTNVDYELFTLLAGHAATALFSSKLYSESERKLSTIQGFLELLTKK